MATFNSESNIWTCYADPKLDVIPIGSYLGPAVLKHLRKRDPNRVSEFHYDTSESVTFQEILERTLTIAKNLQDLGIGKDDIIGLYSGHNTYTSSIAFGSFLNGNAWCPFETTDGKLFFYEF